MSGVGDFFSGIGSVLGDVGGMFFGARQAAKQMDFQQYMANTQFQRAARDLERAGLNRVLALGSPAPTPGGASAPGMDLGSKASGASSARAAARLAEENANLVVDQQLLTKQSTAKEAAATDKLVSERRLVDQQILQSISTSAMQDALTGWHRGQTSLIPSMLNELESRARSQSESADRTRSERFGIDWRNKKYEAVDPLVNLLIERLAPALVNGGRYLLDDGPALRTKPMNRAQEEDFFIDRMKRKGVYK